MTRKLVALGIAKNDFQGRQRRPSDAAHHTLARCDLLHRIAAHVLPSETGCIIGWHINSRIFIVTGETNANAQPLHGLIIF